MPVTTYLFVLAIAFSLSSGHILKSKDNNGSRCKATPGTVSWPSEISWTQFNQSLGGRLLRPSPPGAVCHPGQPTYNAEQCAAVTSEWHVYDFHSLDPVSNMWNQYSNDSCLPNVTYPCSDAGYPAYAVDATDATHVKLSFQFAQKYNVRLVVKSSGHDYQGRSTAPGALTIWVHHMQGLKTHASFQPQGCNFVIEGSAVTASGGTNMITLYEELDKINQTVVGGGGKTVAVGGYITGGGHSILGPRYGLGADQVLELEVVTPKGKVLVANECQNQDLFWAMRGGGGSTFGVMTSVTMATHPTPQIVTWDGAIASEAGAPWFWDMIGYVLTQLPYLESKGVSGYPNIYTNTTDPTGTVPFPLSAFFVVFILQDTQNVADIEAILQPIFDHVKATWPEAYMAPLNVVPYPSFLAWFADHYDKGSAGLDLYVGSHLVNAEVFEGDPAALAAAFKSFSEIGGSGSPYLVGGAGVRNAKPRGGGNAVCPAWRKALVHATNGITFPSLNPAARQKALTDLNAAIEPLRQLAPNMGAYINENNPAEPDWQHSFWGENYNRLLKIKRDVDPHDILWCHPCVGNERWEEIGYQLCRIDDYDEKNRSNWL